MWTFTSRSPEWAASQLCLASHLPIASPKPSLPAAQQGYEVDIYESRPWIGGKVASFKDKDGNDIEMGLHVFFGACLLACIACCVAGAKRCSVHRLLTAAASVHACVCVLVYVRQLLPCHLVLAVIACNGHPVRWSRLAGCYFNLFRLMAKCGVLENLLLKEHTHTFCNTVRRCAALPCFACCGRAMLWRCRACHAVLHVCRVALLL